MLAAGVWTLHGMLPVWALHVVSLSGVLGAPGEVLPEVPPPPPVESASPEAFKKPTEAPNIEPGAGSRPKESPRPTISVEDQLRRAQNEYAYGDYERAVESLRSLLYPMRLYSDEQEIETRRYLGLALYLLGRPDEARTEFLKLLYRDPDYELDPFTVAPPIIELFEGVRASHKTELDVIRLRKSEAAMETAPTEGVLRTITLDTVERSDVATFMPFGAGQFVNGDIVWGITFAVLQAVALGVNVGSWAYLRAQNRTYSTEEAPLVQALIIAQAAGAVMFGVTWSISVFHARLNFVPRETRRTIQDAPLSPPTGGRATGLRLQVDF